MAPFPFVVAAEAFDRVQQLPDRLRGVVPGGQHNATAFPRCDFNGRGTPVDRIGARAPRCGKPGYFVS